MKKFKITRINNDEDYTIFEFIKNDDYPKLISQIIDKFEFPEHYGVEDTEYKNPVDQHGYFKNTDGSLQFHVVAGLNKFFFILIKSTPEFKEFLLDNGEFIQN